MGAEKLQVEKTNEKKAKNKEKNGAIMVLLKVDMHCEGCALKIKRATKAFQGVEKVSMDLKSGNVMVEGRFDPVMLRESVERRVHRKVVVETKGKEEEGEVKEEGGHGDADNKAEPEEDEARENGDKKKNSTLLFDIKLHCDCGGCIQKIRKTILSQEGVANVFVDKEKEIITVKGSTDLRSLLPCIAAKLKRIVHIVPPATPEDTFGTNARHRNSRTKNVEKNIKNNRNAERMFLNNDDPCSIPRFREDEQQDPHPSEWPTSMEGYQHNICHAPQIFSDDNPNACVVM